MQPSRREMLRVGLGGLGIITLGGTIPAFMSRFAFADAVANSKISNDNVLVVIQLSGGNDGLNTVVPSSQRDAYLKARHHLVRPERCTSQSGRTIAGEDAGADHR